jgi:hypothetical protein
MKTVDAVAALYPGCTCRCSRSLRRDRFGGLACRVSRAVGTVQRVGALRERKRDEGADVVRKCGQLERPEHDVRIPVAAL